MSNLRVQNLIMNTKPININVDEDKQYACNNNRSITAHTNNPFFAKTGAHSLYVIIARYYPYTVFALTTLNIQMIFKSCQIISIILFQDVNL